MINLQEFVTEALVQVIEGVKNAQERTKSSGGMINPNKTTLAGEAVMWSDGYTSDEYLGQTIEFDVAVVATEEKSIKGGIGVLAAVGYEAKKQSDNSSVSRIKFSVPVFLPQQKPPK